MNFKNKTVLITGASSGIGRELAVQLAEKGARLILVARREDRLRELRDHLPEPESHVYYPCDVSDRDAVQAVCKELLDNGKEIDVLLFNAGVSGEFNIRELSIDEFESKYRVNFFHVVYFLHYLLPGFLERDRGMIAATSSIAAYRGMPGAAIYSSSKAALSTLLESMRVDLWPTGIKVTCISPGFVRSELTDKNKFWMPFLMDTDKAVRIIIRGLEREKPEIHFPWMLTIPAKLSRLMPYNMFARFMQGKRKVRG